ncbi:MAG: glycoside hydrolase family 127 protein [Candidatus Omnitrophica bacterium]|nr:glycoside hydrolase family 127 protein [Candidatus Omnitrophota bacterium]
MAFSSHDYPIQPVSFEQVTIDDSFWAARIRTNRVITIPYAFTKCEDTGRIDNFRAAGKIKYATSFCSNYPFDDSDVFKIIEGAAYSLSVYPDAQLDEYLDRLIASIAAAQEEDGYLYTARTMKSQTPVIWVDGPRWSNLRSGHELYNLGHMYEAAAAHYLATNKRSLLDVALKSADLICRTFGPGKNPGVPGHQEIEIGLVKLYRITGKEEYLDMAKFFLDQRGREDARELYGEYSQDHKPVIEQDKAVGHAVRAAYMYSAMTDIAALTGDEDYKQAIQRIWSNVVDKKFYITGGIGARHGGEAFGDDYELPNLTAYNETCAAIANVLWNYRMFLLFGEAKYIDVLERTLYNGALSGISLRGDRFFYPNPLAAGAGGVERSPWFGCSCCPTNLSRFIPSIPGYIYARKDDSVYVNLFIGSETSFTMQDQKVSIRQESDYPWDGRVNICLSPEKETLFTLKIRIPGWAKNEPTPSDLYHYQKTNKKKATLSINGKKFAYPMEDGYAVVHRLWKKGDKVELNLPMKVRRTIAHENVAEDAGKVALEYGPLVYCVEWPDYDESVFNLLLSDRTPLSVKRNQNMHHLVSFVNVIEGKADALKYSKNKTRLKKTPLRFRAIPYYAWAHRGPGEMTVWLAREIDAAQPTLPPTIASESAVSYSFQRKNGENMLSPAALNDQLEPSDSNDQSIPRFHWWPHQGTQEWVQYDFAKPETVSSVRVYWFDDSGHGNCRVPESWKILYNDQGQWLPASDPGECGVNKDQFNEVSFDAVKTSGLRLEIQLQEGFSGGILEWQVQ